MLANSARKWKAKSQSNETCAQRRSDIMISTRIFRRLKPCFDSARPMLSSDENGKGVRHMGERLSKSARCLSHKAVYIAVLGLVRDYLRRRFIDFKLGAHFLDLRSLLS